MAPKKKLEPWYFKYLRREVNRIWQWSPDRKECKKRARWPGGGAEKYGCEECGKGPLVKGEYQIDHIVPRESTDVWDGWDWYIWRAMCPVELLQLLCLECHHNKSALENAERRKARKP